QCERLSQLVEDLTTSGEPQLNPQKMKELKKICKVSDDYIKHLYHLIMTQLNQEHAEIRFSAFQIADELFARSHQFRTLLVSNFQEFLELTVETDYDQPLPPPKQVAQKLKQMAIKSVQNWQEKYGEAYKKLSLGYHFLKQNKKVDFQDSQARTLAERMREEEKQKRLEKIYSEKAKRAEKDMEETSLEIQECLTELESCFKLLMPDPVDFAINDTDMESDLQGNCNADAPVSFLLEETEDSSLPSTSLLDDEQPCCSKDLPPTLSAQRKGESSCGTSQQEEDSVDEADAEPDEEMDNDDEETCIRNHGFISHKYSLSLNIPTVYLKVQENEDNSAVINNILDFHKLITAKFIPAVQAWIQVFTKAGVNDARLKRAIDLKNTLEAAVKKHDEMNIEYRKRKRKVTSHDDDDDDDDFDFVEVPEKEGYEPHIPDHLRAEYGLEPLNPKPVVIAPQAVKAAVQNPPPRPKRTEEELDPTCAAATLKLIKDKLPIPAARSATVLHGSKRSQREEEKAKAPIVPFGLDLHYWGQEQPTTGKILKFSSQHRFWAPNEMEEEVENEEVASMLKTRYITFAGKFEPVKHKCGAPLPDGSLCERQDRFKCPFHGRIISRDELGNPTNPEDIVRLEREKEKSKEQQPDWQDPELMREIEAATGVDLGSSKCTSKGTKGKGRRKKYPNLTDLKQQTNTSRSRLEKIVFNKGSVKRVAEAMNRVDKRKHEKFANQFNYALN
uniref:UV-stimulated scaffold protein A n=1 Tax=Latimeria chalumnae TaxID=7897 RepID=H3A7S2_LATCH